MLIPELAVNPLASSIIDAFLLTEGCVCVSVCVADTCVYTCDIHQLSVAWQSLCSSVRVAQC